MWRCDWEEIKARSLGLKAGDMLVIPAGVGHRRVSAGDVKAIGAYPRAQSHFDMKREGRGWSLNHSLAGRRALTLIHGYGRNQT
jgi:uncharacterized protein YjlB